MINYVLNIIIGIINIIMSFWMATCTINAFKADKLSLIITFAFLCLSNAAIGLYNIIFSFVKIYKMPKKK